jgi:hypothetical protein
MRKIFTLAAAVLASFSLCAADYTFSASKFSSDKLTVSIDGQDFKIDKAHGGGGSNSYFEGASEYIKLNANNTYTITLPDGFVLTKINIKGYTNKDSDSNGNLSSVAGVAQTDKTFPARKTTDLISHECIANGYNFDVSQTGGTVAIAFGAGNQVCVLITLTGTAPDCTSPTMAWAVEPENGQVGDPDLAAAVSTTPANQTISWASSVPEVATVSADGKIHYVGAGITTISASFTYEGDEYCKKTVTVRKDIVVPIVSNASEANDKLWYYQDNVPASNPDNGLTFGGTKQGSGMFGIKLDSNGKAWFEKAAEKGTLRVGAFYAGGSSSAYEVEVYACDNAGNKSGEALGTLSIPYAGGVSGLMNIDAATTGIYIQRKTNSEGVLYFIEFKAGAEATAIDNTEVDAKVMKTFENGQLVIIKNGVKYNAQGAIVK